MFSSNTASFAVTVLLAVVFGTAYKPPAAFEPAHLLRALSTAAGASPRGLTIALGTNVCVDLVVPARDALGATGGVTPSDASFLASRPDAIGAFLHHAARGAAGERSAEPSVLAGLVASANASPSARRTLGGNAALMARKLARAGVSVVLGGHVGPAALAALPPGVKLASPLASDDEVHLILEYSAGEAFTGAASPAPRANRFIITADTANTDAAAGLRVTLKAADEHGALVLVLAGLHMLEPLPPAKRAAALEGVAAALGTRRAGLAVHVELASLADASFAREIASHVFPHAASLGFNEQEGAFLYAALGGPSLGSADVLTGIVPRVAPTSTLIRFLLRAHPSLSRIHFHSLAYHIIAHVGSGGDKTWRTDPSAAVAAGVVACATEACAIPDANAADATSLYVACPARLGVSDPEGDGKKGTTAFRRLSVDAPIARWAWPLSANATSEGEGPLVEFALAPVPVCRAPKSTVGLGDAVSAAGLAADVA